MALCGVGDGTGGPGRARTSAPAPRGVPAEARHPLAGRRRCGCPWWTSDEWDARCIRCGWDCESGGYDDNSQPLPKYRPRWEGFVAHIREGRTAPYTRKA